ncbi:MAG: hypothetical protein ACXW15_04565 [Acidimicrobiia bacterium]
METRATPKRGFTELDQKDHQVLQKLLTRKNVPADLRISHADNTERTLAIADILAGRAPTSSASTAASHHADSAKPEVAGIIQHQREPTRTPGEQLITRRSRVQSPPPLLTR